MSATAFVLKAVLGIDTSEYEKGLNKAKSMAGTVGGAIGNGLRTVAKVGAVALGAATTAVGAFATSSVKAGAAFDKSMSQVAATMGLTMDEMANQVGSATIKVNGEMQEFSGNLREYAQVMGANTAFSATQAADALNYMALAGYDTQQSMEMLPNVLNLASAGNMELARASDMVTDTQTAFGISAERTTQLVDEMAKASSTGNTSVEQLGDAFLTVGGLAQELNGGMVELSDGTTASVDGIQELEIALTAMANAGVKGSEAGTHMRNMLLKLSSPTDDGVAAFKQLGVEVFDAGGKMRSLEDIFTDLSAGMDKLTQEEKLQAISDIFNTRDTAAAEALLDAVGQDWDKIGGAILDAEGAAQQMADTQWDNLTGDVKLFKSALEGAQIAVSDGLTPTLRKFVQFGTSGLSKITDAFKKGGVTGAMGAFGEVLSEGLTMVTEMLPEMVNAGMELLGAIGQGIMDNLPTLIDAAIQIASQLGQGLMQAAPALLEGAIMLITQLGQALITALPTMVPQIINLVMQLAQMLVDNAPAMIKGAVALIVGLANGLIQNLPTLIPAVIDMIMQIVMALTEPDNLVMLIEAALQLIVALAQGLVNAIPTLIQAVPVIIQNLVTAFVNSIPAIMKAGVDLIMAMVKGILSMYVEFQKAAPQLLESLVQGFVNGWAKVITTGREIVNKIKQGFMEKVNEAKTWGKDLIDNFIGGLLDKWDKLKDTVGDIAQSIKDLLGFSEPKIGPLSDFHTYAPDMMKLFAQGIRDNEDIVTDQIKESFDFGKMIANVPSSDAQTSNQSDIIRLLEEIAANKEIHVTFEGGLDRFFRAIQIESQRNKQITGQESFA